MAKNNQKKDKVLYTIIIGLVVLMIGMFCYFQSKINKYQEYVEGSSNAIVTMLKKISNVIELNYLDTDNFKYLVNPNNWEESLKNETALDLNNLGDYQIDKVIVRKYTNASEDDLNEYTIYLNMLNNKAFNDFTSLMYQKINEIFVITNNDTSKVESFKEGRGYYDISSFEEATYNNMYYDYMKTLSDGTTGGPKIKVKILYLEETNQIKMEINKF